MDNLLSLYNGQPAQFVQWTTCSVCTMDNLLILYNGQAAQFVNGQPAQFVQWTTCSICTMDNLLSLYNEQPAQFVQWTTCSVCRMYLSKFRKQLCQQSVVYSLMYSNRLLKFLEQRRYKHCENALTVGL